MTARILVVEDEAAIAESIAYHVIAAGMAVDVMRDGQTACRADHDSFDLVVLDLGLPDLPGLEVCRQIRAASIVPILILTARTGESDRVLGLELGADDYLGKPFSMPELLSRIRALLRRRDLDRTEIARNLDREAGRGHAGRTRSHDGLHLDPVEHAVTVDGRLTLLTPTEFRLLALLADHVGRPVGRRQIAAHLSRGGTVVDPRTCTSHVKNLRRKLEADPAKPRRVLTVRGAGYLLRETTPDP